MVPGIRGRKAPAPALIWLVSDPIHSMSTQITDKKAVAFFKMSRSILQPLDVSSKPSQFLSLRRRQGTLRASALIRLSLSGPAAHRGFCKIHLPAHSAGSATVSANQIDNLCFEFETAISLPLRLRRTLKGQYRPISGVDQIRPGSLSAYRASVDPVLCYLSGVSLSSTLRTLSSMVCARLVRVPSLVVVTPM